MLSGTRKLVLKAVLSYKRRKTFLKSLLITLTAIMI